MVKVSSSPASSILPSSPPWTSLASRAAPRLLVREISSPSTVPRSQASTSLPSQRYAAAWLPRTATAMAAESSSVRPAYTTLFGNFSTSVLGRRRRGGEGVGLGGSLVAGAEVGAAGLVAAAGGEAAGLGLPA